jgi:oligoribonuclease
VKAGNRQTNLIWLDMEMTGLNPEEDVIIEIATIVTDKDLRILAYGPNLVVSQPKHAMDAMDEWCTKTHGDTGLTAQVLASDLTLDQAERQTVEFLNKWVDLGASPLCGNSIGQDRRFIYRYMPKLAEYCHYRSIDVSTLKELARRWRPELLEGFHKKGTHKALDDIIESIEELKYYRQHLLIAPLELNLDF